MRHCILVLTGEKDPMWPFLFRACNSYERNKLFLLPTDRPDIASLTYNPIDKKIKVFLPDKILTEKDIRSIWLRRLPPPNFSHFNPQFAEYCMKEYRDFYEGLEYASSEIFWVSKPSAINKAKNKPWQLSVAKGLGFNTPNTIFTNSPDNLEKFCQNRKAVYKSIKSPRISMSEEMNITVFTTVLGKKLIPLKDGLISCPAILQNFCDKDADIRVSVFGDKVFAVKIESQKHSRAKIDFRIGARYVPHSIFELPSKISNLCVRLLVKLDLSFGAIDLALMKDESFIFFEINPNGQ